MTDLGLMMLFNQKTVHLLISCFDYWIVVF